MCLLYGITGHVNTGFLQAGFQLFQTGFRFFVSRTEIRFSFNIPKYNNKIFFPAEAGV